MTPFCHNGLVELLVQAEKDGRGQVERHKMAMIYGGAVHEWTRYKPMPTYEPAKTEWIKGAYEHAKIKVDNYIRRHE